MIRENIVVAIDGYSSCGKSTVAKALAKRLNYIYIDTGAMYRAVTLYLIEHAVDIDDLAEVKKSLSLINIQLIPEEYGTKVCLNGKDVTDDIREMRISKLVSKISAIKEVREAMVALQKEMRNDGDIVMDGRDIGTTVFPDAQLKIFMTADPRIRAERRYAELIKAGKQVTLEEVYENLEKRDYEDTTRKESPLTKSADAIVLDNTDLTQEEQLEFVTNEVNRVIKATKT